MKMDAPTEIKHRSDLSDYLAAERTLLAWIRTGLVLMGFGFVVARFGFFLQQLHISEHTLAESYDLSPWFSTVLIAVGVVVNIFADGITCDWSRSWIRVERNTLVLRSRLSRLLSFWP
jgi:putative membrane protein